MTDTPSHRLSLARIRAAAETVHPVFRDTPQVEAPALSGVLGCIAVMKVETLNPVRCFKGRGATWLMAEAARTDDTRSMVTASVGNFGQAMAWAARAQGRSLTIFAAETASPLKIGLMRALGAEIRLEGADFDAAKAAARAHAEATGARLVEDGADIETAEGAGTMGLELAAMDPPLDAVLVPLGNGAMVTGLGAALKALSPGTEVIAVQAAGAPAMTLSWREGRAIETPGVDTIADGIAIRVPIAEAVADTRALVDDMVLVEDLDTIAGMAAFERHAGLVVEPAAGIAAGAVLADPARFAGRRVGLIVCGANVTPEQRRGWFDMADAWHAQPALGGGQA
ncbi:MAG: pyridoxal-phosphate dependent enzyme [Pseudomonadota bacterium]